MADQAKQEDGTSQDPVAKDQAQDTTKPPVDYGKAPDAKVTGVDDDSSLEGKIVTEYGADRVDLSGKLNPPPAQDAGQAGKVVSEQVPEQAPEVKITESKQQSTNPLAFVEQEIENLSTTSQVALGQLLIYVKKMAPKLGTPIREQILQQATLHRVLTQVINHVPDDEFVKVWSLILKSFHTLRDGVFHELYVFRHTDNVNLAPTKIESFLSLLNLIKLTADPKGRKEGLKNLDIQKTLKHDLTDTGRQRLLGFYNL